MSLIFLYWIHILGVLYLFFYFLLAFYWKQSLKREIHLEGSSSIEKYWFPSFYATRIALYVLIFLFLTGGKMGTPYFKSKALWIFFKLGIWLVLIMLISLWAMRGLKGIRKGMEEENSMLIEQGLQRLTLFLHFGLTLFLLACFLGYFKPL